MPQWTKPGHFSAILTKNSNLLYTTAHLWIRDALLSFGPTDGMTLKMNPRYVNWIKDKKEWMQKDGQIQSNQ